MTTNLLPVNSILNPRDLGGIVGLDGRKIKTHRLIRTGTLIRMSDEDIQFLKNYGLGLNKCGINLAVNLSSTKPKTTRLTYVHQQLMLSKINN